MTRARELADLLTGGQTITTADNNPQLTLESTDADANFGPVLKMHRNSGSPADSDFLGELQLKGENDAGEEILYAQMFGRTSDVSDGTEDGRIATKIMINGTAQNVLDIKSDEIVINDDSVDLDFRVESDNDANAFFVQGSSGNVGIGTNSPAGIHSQAEVLEISGGDGGDLIIGNNSSTNIGAGAHIGAIAFKNIDGSTGTVPHYAGIRCEAEDTSGNMDLRFYTGIANLEADTPQAIIDKDGLVGIGTAAPAELLHLNANNPEFTMQAATDGGECSIYFKDDDGNKDGRITYRTDYAGQTDNFMSFFTNGSQRMQIAGDGDWSVSATGNFQSLESNNASTARSLFYGGNYMVIASYQELTQVLNRMGNDGMLVSFRQGGTQEGNISVSGSTVSYNGGHLSRWSQATDGNRIDGLVKGTVMTNLDQMAVWHHEAQAATYYEEGDELPDGVSVGDEKTAAVAAYDEDNEQLNCMAVSSVEGDPNVAGVFVNWDDDDEDFTADMNVAMTGDMVIRIAQGTTVARGDLLMSAGDGTAKPQGDDIVRSKTIAKVTSTTKSHTYDDGSYLVPCVLMAC